MESLPTGPAGSPLPSLHELTVFTVLSRARTITDAAADLHLSQSQISRTLRGLERKLEVRLFDRSTAGLRLTAEGSVFAETCASIRAAYAKEMRNFENRIAGEAGDIRVSVLPSMAFEYMGPWTNSFRAAYPDATVTATDDISGTALSSVLAGESDVAISACVLLRPDGEEQILFPEVARMSVVPLLTERFYLLSPPQHEVPEEPDWKYAFERTTVSFTERTSVQRCLNFIASTEGCSYQPETLTNSPLTIAGLVEAGMGCSIVPESNLGLMQIRELQTAPLPGYQRVVCIASQQQEPIPLVRHFIRTLIEMTEEHHRG